MHYDKPALSFEQQAQRLIDRGMIVEDRTLLIQRLGAVSYYRLSAYWFIFKQPGERFAPGTNFEQIWRYYTFDRRLRVLVLDAIEWVEVAILRTRLVEQFTLLHGPFGYRDPANFKPEFSRPGYRGDIGHDKLMHEIEDSVDRSREVFVEHFRTKYTSEPHLPLWMVGEVMSFGALFTFYRNMHRTEQQTLAQGCGVRPPVLESWLHTLNFIRNACAHHSRLWNRELPIRPLIPHARNNPEWHQPSTPDNDRIYAVLMLLRFLLKRFAPESHWQRRFETLLSDYPEMPLGMMGFPPDWRESPIWS
jgi:abortive infection bacteriophage resistance protein